MNRILNLIVAADVNGCIGHKGPKPLVWKQSADMKRFRELTTDQIVIMGRNTFESMGKPLPNRVNVIVTKNNKESMLARGDVIVTESLEEAIALTSTAFPDKKLFLIGGAMLYNYAIIEDLVDKFFITVIKTAIHGDAIVRFPDFSHSEKWQRNENICLEADEKNQFKSFFMDVRRK